MTSLIDQQWGLGVVFAAHGSGSAPGEGAPDAGVIDRFEVRRPERYQVLMLNDDYTPMDFVVLVLMRFFNKTMEDAEVLMLQVHNNGRAICGDYPREIAETRVAQVMKLARQEEHPLRCILEKKP